VSSTTPASTATLRDRDTRGERHWLAFRLPSLLVLAGLALVPLAALGFDACPFHLLTSYPCPFCGLSRSVGCLLHFDIAGSLSYHPLGIIALVFLITCAATNKPNFLPVHLQRRTGINLHGKTGVVLLATFVVVWLIRLLSSGTYL
jgi:hypothetical protein